MNDKGIIGNDGAITIYSLGHLCPGEYRFRHAFLVDVRCQISDVRFPIVVDSHKIEY